MGKQNSIVCSIGKLMDICSQQDFLNPFCLKLSSIKGKYENPTITVPITGEFSSGKTTLCNMLLEKDILPTDVLPSTTTVYELRFSCEKDKAEIINIHGDIVETINDLSELKNRQTSSDELVKIESVSKQLPEGIVIVDTPGLSSSIPIHKERLMNYVVNADTLVVCVDSNQGFTTSILNFLDTVNPLNKRTYFVLTKSDTITQIEMDSIQKHSEENLPIKPYKVISTSIYSADKNNFINLLNDIYQDKMEIIEENTTKEFDKMCEEIEQILNIQLSSAELNTDEIDRKIKEIKFQIDTIRQQMSDKINNTREQFKLGEKDAIREFDDSFYKDMPGLVSIDYKEREKLIPSFNDSIKRALQKSKEKYQMNIKQDLNNFQKEVIEDIVNRIRVDESIALDIQEFLPHAIETVIEIALFDVIIPAKYLPGKLGSLEKGPLDGVLGKLSVEFFGKDGYSAVKKSLENLIGDLIKLVTKPFVEASLQKSKELAKEMLEDELSKISNYEINKIEEKITTEFQSMEKAAVESLERLKGEKGKTEEEFYRYIEDLKNIQKELEDIRKK